MELRFGKLETLGGFLLFADDVVLFNLDLHYFKCFSVCAGLGLHTTLIGFTLFESLLILSVHSILV